MKRPELPPLAACVALLAIAPATMAQAQIHIVAPPTRSPPRQKTAEEIVAEQNAARIAAAAAERQRRAAEERERKIQQAAKAEAARLNLPPGRQAEARRLIEMRMAAGLTVETDTSAERAAQEAERQRKEIADKEAVRQAAISAADAKAKAEREAAMARIRAYHKKNGNRQ